MKRILILFLIVVVFGNMVVAQSSHRLLQHANNEFAKMKYAYAIPMYDAYLKHGGKDSIALLHLAICYAKQNQYDSAIIYFEKANLKGLNSSNYLPELYAIKGDYSNAKKYYLSIKNTQSSLLTDARLYGFEHLADYYADSLDYRIEKLKFNTLFNEYGAMPYKGGLVFESNRASSKNNTLHNKNIAGWDGKSYAHLYIYNLKDSSVQFFSPRFKNKLNVGAISFTSDGKTAYYTKNANTKNKAGVYQLEIWEAKWKGGEWTSGVKMFFNNNNFSYFHPFITPDGMRLYYVCDDPAGMGGTDIYYVDKNEDGSWKNTQNAGADVNTQGNELFPTFYANTLYFSSNGRPGLGGLDIYKLTKSKLHLGDWEVQNLGYPINSSRDDFSFSILDSIGYLSSNRSGNDDIYTFKYNKVWMEMQGQIVTDSNVKHSNTLFVVSKNAQGESYLDSVKIDEKGNYSIKARANTHYQLYVIDNLGAKHSFDMNTNHFSSNNGKVQQNNAVLAVAPLEDQWKAIKAQQAASQQKDLVVMTRQFKRAIDSLSTMTKQLTILHHPFDKAYVVKEDLNEYYKLIELVKKTKGKRIVIVSASDCVGGDAYNKELSVKRSNRIEKTLSALSENEVVVKPVGKSELINDCEDVKNQKNNRYSYVFIMNK